MLRRAVLWVLGVGGMALLGFVLGLGLVGKLPGQTTAPLPEVEVLPFPTSPSDTPAEDPPAPGPEADRDIVVPDLTPVEPAAPAEEAAPPAQDEAPAEAPAETPIETPPAPQPESDADGVTVPDPDPAAGPAASAEGDPSATPENTPESTEAPSVTEPPAAESPTAESLALDSLARRPGDAAQPLDSLNAVRALAGLPKVTRNPAWEAGCVAHARYLARDDKAEHREDPASPNRTPQGEACAPGHYFVSSQPDSGPERAVNYWATGAFHLPQLLDPRLKTAALGVAYDNGGEILSAAVLDVRRGLTGTAGAAAYPVRFPGPGAVSPLREAARFEWPDPLAGCPGYEHPVGAPVALLLGGGGPVLTAAIKVGGQAVAACLLTAGTFSGESAADTQAGRNVLGAQGAAILLPRRPLPPGATVRVSFRTGTRAEAWSFKVK